MKIGEQNGGEQAHEGSYQVDKCPYSGLENVVVVRGSGPHALHYNGQPGHSMKEIIVSRNVQSQFFEEQRCMYLVF